MLERLKRVFSKVEPPGQGENDRASGWVESLAWRNWHEAGQTATINAEMESLSSGIDKEVTWLTLHHFGLCAKTIRKATLEIERGHQLFHNLEDEWLTGKHRLTEVTVGLEKIELIWKTENGEEYDSSSLPNNSTITYQFQNLGLCLFWPPRLEFTESSQGLSYNCMFPLDYVRVSL